MVVLKLSFFIDQTRALDSVVLCNRNYKLLHKSRYKKDAPSLVVKLNKAGLKKDRRCAIKFRLEKGVLRLIRSSQSRANNLTILRVSVRPCVCVLGNLNLQTKHAKQPPRMLNVTLPLCRSNWRQAVTLKNGRVQYWKA